MNLAPGWALAAGPHTNVSDIQNCSTAAFVGKYCVGIVGVLNLISPTLMTLYTAASGSATSSAVALSCPVGITNTAGGSAFTDCTDLKAGYAMLPGVRARVMDIAALLRVLMQAPDLLRFRRRAKA